MRRSTVLILLLQLVSSGKTFQIIKVPLIVTLPTPNRISLNFYHAAQGANVIMATVTAAGIFADETLRM
jgi:hypothetical protein